MASVVPPVDPVIRVFRRFIAGRTVAIGQRNDDALENSFLELTNYLVEVGDRSQNGDDELRARLDLLKSENDLYVGDRLGYLSLLDQALATPAVTTNDNTTRGMGRGEQTASAAVASPENRGSIDINQVTQTAPRLAWMLVTAAAAAAAVLLSAFDGFSCGLFRTLCYDSGWVNVDNARTKTWVFNHRMAQTPTRVDILFWPPGEAERWFPVALDVDYSGNPINVELTPRDIILHIYGSAPLRNVFDAGTGQWSSYSSGRFRIIARTN
jgi:hypothetical protein